MWGERSVSSQPISGEDLGREFSIPGTRSIGSAELAEITNVFAEPTFNDDAEELRERLRAQLQDHGFFTDTG